MSGCREQSTGTHDLAQRPLWCFGYDGGDTGTMTAPRRRVAARAQIITAGAWESAGTAAERHHARAVQPPNRNGGADNVVVPLTVRL